jgi:DNA-binding Lrp family transcriptional regulator
MGIKAEIKPSLDVSVDWYYYARGKFSELKERYSDFKEVINEWEKYLEAIKSVLVDGMELKEFEEKVLDLILGKKETSSFDELIERYTGEDMDIKTKAKLLADALAEMPKEEVEKTLTRFRKELNIISVIRRILDLNGISYDDGKIHGVLSDDPELIIYMDVDEETAEKLKLKSEFIVSVEKQNQLYVSLTDALYEIERLRDACKEHTELFELFIVVEAITTMLDKLEGKRDVEEFIREVSTITKEGAEITLSRDAIDVILKTLEKSEIIRLKKGKIFLRR